MHGAKGAWLSCRAHAFKHLQVPSCSVLWLCLFDAYTFCLRVPCMEGLVWGLGQWTAFSSVGEQIAIPRHVYSNACGVGKKCEELEICVQLWGCDLAEVTGTWWDSSCAWSAVMGRYRLFRKGSPGRQEGKDYPWCERAAGMHGALPRAGWGANWESMGGD